MSKLNLKLGGGSPTQTIYTIGALLLIAGLAGSYQFLMPNLRTANTEASTEQTKYQGLKQDADNLQSISIQLVKAKQKLSDKGLTPEVLSSIIPDTEDMPDLYIQMENFVSTWKPSTALTYQLGTPTSTPDGVHIPVTLVGTGVYSQLKQLVHSIEVMQRPVTISTISFVALPGKTSTITGSDGKPHTVGIMTMSATGFIRAKALSSAYATK